MASNLEAMRTIVVDRDMLRHLLPRPKAAKPVPDREPLKRKPRQQADANGNVSCGERGNALGSTADLIIIAHCAGRRSIMH